jgi:glyoxylase-like metal-dependent hydrolase (beta-lactamase superfamily II)
MNRLASLAAITALVTIAVAPAAFSQGQDFSAVQEKVTDLGHNIYAVTGAGGNTTVAVGTDGVVVVDTQFGQVYDKLKAAIAGLSPLPVKYVINTHYHGDHTGGNAAFAKDGATLVAYKTLPDRMAHPLPGPAGPIPPSPTMALPTKLYSGSSMTLRIPGVNADLVHPSPAHTDTDTIVMFKAANVIATGDIVGSASYPYIDVASGGGIDGMISAASYIVRQSNAQTKIVPGHGPVTDRDGVIAYRAMLQTARDRIAKAKASGMTEDQVANGNLLADLDVKWKPPGNQPSRFPRQVYESVK